MAAKTFDCPVCGEDVPAQAKSCPHCGACEKSGWGDTSADLGLPGEDGFDYEKFTAEEFGIGKKARSKWSFLKVAGVTLIVLALIGYVYSFTFR